MWLCTVGSEFQHDRAMNSHLGSLWPLGQPLWNAAQERRGRCGTDLSDIHIGTCYTVSLALTLSPSLFSLFGEEDILLRAGPFKSGEGPLQVIRPLTLTQRQTNDTLQYFQGLAVHMGPVKCCAVMLLFLQSSKGHWQLSTRFG